MKALIKQLRTTLRLTKAQAKAIHIVAQHEIETSEVMDLNEAEMELQSLRSVDLEKSIEIFFGLAESKHLRIVDLNEIDESSFGFQVSCHPKILAFLRAGINGYLNEFKRCQDHDAVAAIAEFIESVRKEREHFFFFEEAAGFPRKAQELQQLICREQIFIAMGGNEDHECAFLASLACGQFALNRQSLDCPEWLNITQPNLTLQSELRKRWTADHPLFMDGWLVAEDADAEGRVLRATPSEATRELLDLDRQLAPAQTVWNLFEVVAAEQIAEVELVYPEKEAADVAEWKQLLTSDAPDRRVADAALRPIEKRYTFLVDGPSGSGKTALVYNLAKTSSRTLIRVKLESLRGKYVGESERLVAQLFQDIRSFQRSSPSVPIILLDECDGLLGDRVKASNYSHNVETNIITIVLQELDRFRGILFCTTNHAEFMDNAFYRRMTFQLTLPAPDAVTRFKILKRYFPELSDAARKLLADETVFTAAQAEMAANQMTLLHASNGETKADVEAIRTRINSVAIHSRDGQLGTRRIGFFAHNQRRA